MRSDSAEATTTVIFQDIEVTATRGRLWQVEAAGRVASGEFLDQALERALPRLTPADLDRLLIELLMAVTTDQA
jgi:hypothetical protein